ncbi:hypothetical protein NHH03_18570 [Stieleria sp. TO1_6]|uniref:hypothetical protein n=1 Tax=Stieleria tagensis TaxID=2956795 RepID=UPI00209B59BB|nr:hypothetical protein [Stieleria tagensis]MCO8123757.1 hypothetical protein [Stieleria tagensis]
MSESLALARLLISRNRLLISLAVGYLVVIHLSVLVYWAGGFDDALGTEQVTVVAILLASMPLLLITVGLFEFNDHGDISTGATGYHPWLLRSPLNSWTLAVVPLAMKTIWILFVVATAATTIRLTGYPLQRWLLPTIGLATLPAIGAWLVWRPFRWDYTKLTLVVVMIVPAYGWFLLCASLALNFDLSNRSPAILRHSQHLIPVAWIVGMSLYVLAVWLAYRSVRLARCHTTGLPRESAGWWFGRTTADDHQAIAATATTTPPIPAAIVSPTRALLRFDLTKLLGVAGRITAVCWLIGVGSVSMIQVPTLQELIGMIIVSLYPGAMASAWIFAGRDGRFLPNLIAVAPIASSTVVWTRQAMITAIWYAVLAGVPLTLLVWWLTGHGDKLFFAWNTSMQQSFADPDAGWKIALAYTLAGIILVARHTTWSVATESTGNQRYGLYSVVGKVLTTFACLSWFLYHFLRFPNWEAWQAWGWEQINLLPSLLPWLLAFKLALVVAAAIALSRSMLTTPSTLALLLTAYIVGTLVCGYLFWIWIPSDNVLLWHCVAATAIVLPISRILVAPICLARNRHRS